MSENLTAHIGLNAHIEAVLRYLEKYAARVSDVHLFTLTQVLSSNLYSEDKEAVALAAETALSSLLDVMQELMP